MIASQLVLVYGTYLIATASPGPSNMAIMGTAMRDGRRSALARNEPSLCSGGEKSGAQDAALSRTVSAGCAHAYGQS